MLAFYLKLYLPSPHISSFFFSLFSTIAFNIKLLNFIICLPLLECKLHESSAYFLLFIVIFLTLPQPSHLGILIVFPISVQCPVFILGVALITPFSLSLFVTCTMSRAPCKVCTVSVYCLTEFYRWVLYLMCRILH